MSALMEDPIDHWLDLNTQPVRSALRVEMFAAFDAALDAPTDPGHRKAAWTGVGTGYAVAFGLVTREALDRARRVPGALTVHPDDLHIRPSTDEEECWASGVLYGYKQGTAEQDDADDCLHCGQRLTALDEPSSCEHGSFCDEHILDWHANTYPVGLRCTFEDERYEDAS